MTQPTGPVVPGPRDPDGRWCTVAFALGHPLVRAGAVWAATAEQSFRVVESVESVEALAVATPADLTVVETDSLGRPPCAARITALTGVSKVVLLASSDDPATRAFAADTGVHAVVEHDTEVMDLVAAMHRLAGQVRAAREPAPSGGRSPLSRREIETMRHIGDGLTYRQVARRMGLSEATVGTYARRIREKLNAANKVEMVINAMESGYVDRPGTSVAPGRSPVAS
ncbi:response regulator transcription factor [Lentzea sp. HUAS12]|uniref:helix-turn-helix transcriptional regulator n=1 Tax=Lentzea sp. HUAS12 TaxID=2951806 RepID=UPI00209C8AF8|nr:response regulator transcription factor [Lentzea sp. HUAS12]USX53400.1 response regulator transcription factor [Lentzea sp. HUAS12]